MSPSTVPVCRLIDTILIANGTALRAELGRGLVAMTRCAVASDETAIELDPGRVARRSFEADLWLDRCTLVAGRSIIGLGRWPGVLAGPDRPWLIHSRRCAFLTLVRPEGPRRGAAPRRRRRLSRGVACSGRPMATPTSWIAVVTSHGRRVRSPSGASRRDPSTSVGPLLGGQSRRPGW